MVQMTCITWALILYLAQRFKGKSQPWDALGGIEVVKASHRMSWMSSHPRLGRQILADLMADLGM